MVRNLFNTILKSVLAGLLVSSAFSAFSLNLRVSGSVSQYGFPAVNVRISIIPNSTNPIVVYSDSLGNYDQSFNVVPDSGYVDVELIECNGFRSSQRLNYDTITTVFSNINFNYCSDSLLFIKGNVLNGTSPMNQFTVRFSSNSFQSILDSAITDQSGNFFLTTSIPNQVMGILEYSYLNCNQTLSFDSIFYRLGDTLNLNIQTCPGGQNQKMGFLRPMTAFSVAGFKVQLIGYDSASSQLELLQEASVDPQGRYFLDPFDDDYYLLRAIPPTNSAFSANVPPVYFGLRHFWWDAAAEYLSMNSPMPSFTVMELFGNLDSAQFTGRVNYSSDMDSNLARVPVLLLDPLDSSVISYALQDGNGSFEMSAPAEGRYLVYLDYPGLPTTAAEVDLVKGLNNLDVQIFINPGGVSVNAFVGIPEDESEVLKAYPNPFKDHLKLNLDQETLVNVYNSSGQSIYNQLVRRGELIMDSSDWPPGIYFVQVQTAKSDLQRLKMIKL